MPEIREVTVEFRKTVSDGSYGNETYSVRHTEVPDSGEAWESVAFRLAERAHDVVLSRLRASTNEFIREALETPEERQARRERERAERDAERERWRLQAEREAREPAPPDTPPPFPDGDDADEDEGADEEDDGDSPF